MIQHLGHALYRRAVAGDGADSGGGYDLQVPNWGFFVLVADFIVFLPILFFISYTLGMIYPVFTMVEDENPPAYEPLASTDGAEPAKKPYNFTGVTPDGRPKTVTSSIRSLYRLLRSIDGFRANFRGVMCACTIGLLNVILQGVFSGIFGGPSTSIATILTSICLVQLRAAWVHIIISHRSPHRFWHRLPPFKRTLKATWKPMALSWFAMELSRWIPIFVGYSLGIIVHPFFKMESNELQGSPAKVYGGLAVVTIVAMICSIVLTVPADVILVRVQASLLAPEEHTIVPFDRSFGGKVEPALVGGSGYATISDAWTTFSKAAWRRLIVLYVKVYGLTIFAMAAFIGSMVTLTHLISLNVKVVAN